MASSVTNLDCSHDLFREGRGLAGRNRLTDAEIASPKSNRFVINSHPISLKTAKPLIPRDLKNPDLKDRDVSGRRGRRPSH